jgi:hypothetical protein
MPYRRVGSGKAPGDVKISLITDFVSSQLTIHVLNVRCHEMIQLHKHFCSNSFSSREDRRVFEAYGQLLFQQLEWILLCISMA